MIEADPMEMEPMQQEPQPLEVLQQIMATENVAEMLDDAELARIGDLAVREWKLDKDSMKEWFDRMNRGIDLATLIKKEKTYPFKHAANVKYPLITTAALQFNARAYPAIVPSDQVVRAKTYGKDPTGAKAARGERISEHMSYDLTCNVPEWEEETDRLLVVLPVVGTMVKKWWHDGTRKRCRLIDPGKFIVNDRVKTLAVAPRLTEEIELFPTEIDERKRSGRFLDREYVEDQGEDSAPIQDFIEQHRYMDLDGDGIEEPYIITVHCTSKKVARIVADFDAEDVRMGPQGIIAIDRGHYFVDYHFLPSISGGFWSTGLGLLLGDISDTINTIINQMLDAGHMASLGGGFIGSEFRLKGGSQRFSPGEWKMTQTKGQDVRSAVVPMTFPGPSDVLFQLLGLLIDAGREIASVKDIMTGDTGTKNMTATTTLALIEQGMMVFTAAYKRIFRSLKHEFKLVAKMNAATTTPEEYNAFHDMTDPNGMPIMLDPRAEYDLRDMDITPVADPRSVTNMQETAKAQIVMEMSGMGLVNPQAASARILEAANIGDVEELMPQPDPMAEAQSQMAMAMMESEVALAMAKVEQELAKIEETRSKTVKNLSDAAATGAVIRLDQVRLALEAARDGLGQALGRNAGGMAQPPGGVGDPGAIPGLAGSGPAGGDPRLLGGGAMGGIGAPGAYPGGGAAY